MQRVAKLLENPRTVPQEMGIAIPDGLGIKVVEDKPDEINMIVPFNSASGELSDADLEAVAGGKDKNKVCGGFAGGWTSACGISAALTTGVTAVGSLLGVGGAGIASAM